MKKGLIVLSLALSMAAQVFAVSAIDLQSGGAYDPKYRNATPNAQRVVPSQNERQPVNPRYDRTR